jgi:hypothetical protein
VEVSRNCVAGNSAALGMTKLRLAAHLKIR